MANIGNLVYRKSGADVGRLVYRSSGNDIGHLLYHSGEFKTMDITVSFAWNGDGKDLDICGYWDSAPDLKVGYSYNYTYPAAYQTYSTTVGGNLYVIGYSGDIRGVADSEWIKLTQECAKLGSRKFNIHFNYYQYGPNYPLMTCSVIASQENGATMVLQNVPCGTHGSPIQATTSDPGVTISFNADGILSGISALS